jgi:hypothetical protein
LNNYLINFKKIKWNIIAPGFREKTHIDKNKKFRIIEFTDELDEENWCLKGHIGYVLEGVLNIDFNGNNVTFNTGDGIFIPSGEENKHKAWIVKGEKALFLLVDDHLPQINE